MDNNLDGKLINNLDPDLYNTLEVFRRNLLSRFNCIKIGIINKFYPMDKTADVEIACKKTDANGNIKEFPIVLHALIVGNKITLPIEPGEACVILFCDYDINNWFETGIINQPRTTRMHDLCDSIAFTGLNSLTNVIVYDNENISMQFRQSTFKIGNTIEANSPNMNIKADVAVTGNQTVSGDLSNQGKMSAGNGASGSFQDTGQGASYKTLTIENGIVTKIG